MKPRHRGVGSGARDVHRDRRAVKARKRNHVAGDSGDGTEDALQANGDLGHRLGRGRGQRKADLLTDREVTDDAGRRAFEVGGRCGGGVVVEVPW